MLFWVCVCCWFRRQISNWAFKVQIRIAFSLRDYKFIIVLLVVGFFLLLLYNLCLAMQVFSLLILLTSYWLTASFFLFNVT